MNANQMKVIAAAVAALVAAPSWAADAAGAGTEVSGEFTLKVYGFDYFKGYDAGRTHYLERYNYQKGFGNDNRSGVYLDADLKLVVEDGRHPLFAFERHGFGAYNHRNLLRANTDNLGFVGYYTGFRSATGGVDYLYGPNVVDQVFGAGTGTAPNYGSPVGPVNTQTGYAARFNNDSPDQANYKIDRDTYGVGLALKPALFGTTAAAALNYDGYKREGNRFATYVLGASNATNPPGTDSGTQERWRGLDKPVDENMNRFSLNLGAAPGGYTLAYQGSIEKFDNGARNFTIADIAAIRPEVNPSVRPIHFVPDSTLISNNARMAKNFGSTAVAAGYGVSILDQDSFSQQQQAAGYNTGKITTNGAYLNISSNALKGVGLEGVVKYSTRDNDSDFPVTGLISATAEEALDVRINRIKTLNYGLAARFRPSTLKSSVTVGWKREDKDRDLTWTAVSTVAPTVNGIQPQRSLYREQTLSDELYASWVARPMPGMIFRLTPSYVWADETGLVSEPEKSLNVKTKLSYTVSSGLLVSGYYNYKNKENSDHAFTNGLTGPIGDGAQTAQKAEKTQQAAGVSLNAAVSEWINTFAGLSWMQDDFEAYFLRSGRRRYETPNNPIVFIIDDRPNFNIDAYVFTLGGDWQVSDPLRLDAAYTWSKSQGHSASGRVEARLAEIDGRIENSLHSLSLGVDYVLKNNLKLKGTYSYEYYTDKVYDDLNGGDHTLMVGAALGF